MREVFKEGIAHTQWKKQAQAVTHFSWLHVSACAPAHSLPYPEGFYNQVRKLDLKIKREKQFENTDLPILQYINKFM
jgi:hypothetical protein